MGSVVEKGEGVERFQAGDRVGVPWLGYTCGACDYCRSGRENLCCGARFTGYPMSDIPAFPYSILWGERTVRSGANLTRRDGEEFLAPAPRVPVRTRVEIFPLSDANEALARLRQGRVQGAAVLAP